MKEIIAITQTEINGAETNSVNSRDIYDYLEVNTKYNDWINRAVEKYDFEENVDYSKMSNGTSRGIDYIVTMDMAKELCMVSNTEKGKETRKYFIAVEKEVNKPMTQLDMMIAQLQNQKKLENSQKQLESKVDKIIDDVVELIEKNNPNEVKPSIGFLAVNSLMSRYGMSKQTVMKVVDAFDPRIEDCSKFIEGVGISEYRAYNRRDMDSAVKELMKYSKAISKFYYTSRYITGRFQCSLVR